MPELRNIRFYNRYQLSILQNFSSKTRCNPGNSRNGKNPSKLSKLWNSSFFDRYQLPNLSDAFPGKKINPGSI